MPCTKRRQEHSMRATEGPDSRACASTRLGTLVVGVDMCMRKGLVPFCATQRSRRSVEESLRSTHAEHAGAGRDRR